MRWLCIITAPLLLLFCVSVNARVNRHDSIEDMVKHMETIHRISHRKMMSLERLVDAQGDIIMNLVNTIEGLKDASLRHKAHIVTLFKRSRRYKRQVHELTKTLNDRCPKDKGNMSEKHDVQHNPHHQSEHNSTERTHAPPKLTQHEHTQVSQYGASHTHHQQGPHNSQESHQKQSAQTDTEQHHGSHSSHSHNHKQTATEAPTSKEDQAQSPKHSNGHNGDHNSHNHHDKGTQHNNGHHGNPNHHGNSRHSTKTPRDHRTHAPAHHDEAEVTTTSPGHHHVDHATGKSDRAARQLSGGIAFTAFLDHDMTLGGHQTLKFNKIITNEGGGYNNHTGVFTCVEAGVYMFTFFIGQRDAGHYMWAELVVNSVNVMDAVVDTYHQYQDLQGGNTAIVRLVQGDRVWIDATHSGSHVEGSDSLRLCSFSGLYLYA